MLGYVIELKFCLYNGTVQIRMQRKFQFRIPLFIVVTTIVVYTHHRCLGLSMSSMTSGHYDRKNVEFYFNAWDQ